MNKFFLSCSLLLVVGACSSADPTVQKANSLISPEEMAIIQAIMDYKELWVSTHKPFSLPLFSRVRPLQVLPSGTPATFSPPDDRFAVHLAELLRRTYHQQRLFVTPQDSSYLLSQTYAADRNLDSTRLAPTDLLTPVAHAQLTRRGQYFCQFSQPLLSSDRTKAYIQLDELGSGRMGFFLVKRGKRWQQVAERLIWVE